MHPSIFLLPAVMVGFGVTKRIFGPYRTLEYSQSMAHGIATTVQKKLGITRHYYPEDLHLELALLARLTPRPLVACFENACAFQQWLACHGEISEIRIGKRLEGDRLYMHAWVETEDAVFFRDGEFEVSFG